MNVRFCPACRSLILADFRYCPYCGVSAPKGPELAEALSRPFDRLGGAGTVPASVLAAGTVPASVPDASASGRARPFAGAEASLDRLEAEMDLILEELAKEGRSRP